jgi:hypothetical protein
MLSFGRAPRRPAAVTTGAYCSPGRGCHFAEGVVGTGLMCVWVPLGRGQVL